jgi:uncharacterized protein involved in outer membrane biogenesis
LGSLLATLTTILVVILTAALAVPYFIDWNAYRDVFEAQAAKVFGRQVKIDGDVDLKLLPLPTLKMHGLRVADDMGKFKRPFAEVKGFDMVLSLPSLLGGTIEAKQLELDQPVIRLEVDELGESNWQNVGPLGSNIPVRQVVLSKVDITNGAFEFRHGKGANPSRIDRISGTLAADSLTGPFRFTGTANVAGDHRDVRLSTSRMENQGFHLKGAIHALSGASLYQVDGQVDGLDGALKYTGPITARLALDTAAKEAGNNGGNGESNPGKAVELRASSTISLENVKLENIAFTLTQNDRPQSLSGSAFASWGDKPRLDIAIDASWLDVDQMLRIVGDQQGTQSAPARAIAALPSVFSGWSFTPQEGVIKAHIQQAGLGGEMIEGFSFEASHNTGGWKIDTLMAKLPGDTDINVTGKLLPGEKFALNGDFSLTGKHLARLLRWAAPSLGAVDAGDAQHFSLNSQVTLGSEKIAFKGAKGELGESAFSGDLVYDFGAASQVVLTLESERLDLRQLFGKQEPTPAVGGETWNPKTEETKTSLADVVRSVFQANSSEVSVRIAHLQMPSLEAKDVRSVLRYENGTFDIGELNLATTDGLSVKAHGHITDFSQKPNGELNLTIDAPNASAVSNLSRLAGFDNVGQAAQRRMDAFAPLQLKGNLNADRKSRELRLTLAGSAAGSELTFNGQLDGDFADLNTSKLDMSGVISNADGRHLIAQLAPEVPVDTSASTSGPGTLKVTASGALKSGLKGSVVLRTAEAQGRFEGRIAPLDNPSWSLDGDINLHAAQATTALSMLRISPGGTPVTGPLEMHATLKKKATKYEIGSLDLQIGGEAVGGSIKVDTAGARPFAEIDIGAGAVMLPRLGAYLVDWDRKDLSSQLAEATTGASIWANQAFSFRAFEVADGTLKIRASSLTLTDGLTLGEAQLQASLKNGALDISALNGQLYGGTFSGTGKLTSERGRIVLDAQLKLDKADLAKIAIDRNGKPLAKGKGELEFTLAGEGFSPRGLIAVVSGNGQLRLQKGTLNGLTPAVLRDAADVYLAEEIPQKDKLLAQITANLWKGTLNFDPLTVPLSVKDGVLQFRDAAINGPDATTTISLMADLASLRLDSEWEIAYTGATKSGEKLPPIRFVFAGPISDFGILSPRLNQEQFERFLSMRRMEEDMERLEKLGQKPARPDGKPKNRPIGGASTPVKEAPTGTGMSNSSDLPTKEGPAWSTTTEKPAPNQEPAQGSPDFEDRIRKALGSNSNQ